MFGFQDEESNSTEVDQNEENTEQDVDDQSGGTPDTSQQTEQPNDQDSGLFNDIDRDTLSPELQATYDNMNRAFTQKTQVLAEQSRTMDQRRDYAAVGELIENNPELNRLVWNGINSLRDGRSVEQQSPNVQQPQGQVPDRTPDEQAAYDMIAGIVGEALDAKLPQALKPLDQFTGYMRQNQARTEYDVLCNKYSAAKTITPMELQNMQLRYSKVDGTSISLEEAFAMMAKDNPALLSVQTSVPPAKTASTKATGKKPASVARGTQRSGTESLTPGTTGFAKLREVALKLTKDGAGGVSNAMARAQEKTRQRNI